MDEAIEQFFASLPARGPQEMRSSLAGTLRIDLSDGERTEHWVLRLRPGVIEVERGPAEADSIWYCSVDLFDRLVTGRAEPLAALFRNECSFSGRVPMFLILRRLFPSAPGVQDPRTRAREQAGTAQ
ncbi:SCP2 sterol-binding domain-containing protein [Micromonospora sp. NPDC048871]|uniref:SCP2 sterol-binding domain-containing protein n=1 Tax=unclassified Micromonospora TaxID=2617518 RepID=UPI002E0FE067|nr:SCP2 sterol-binding domain-containing protein [Micromonospora sp. NBC_01739]